MRWVGGQCMMHSYENGVRWMGMSVTCCDRWIIITYAAAGMCLRCGRLCDDGWGYVCSILASYAACSAMMTDHAYVRQCNDDRSCMRQESM